MFGIVGAILTLISSKNSVTKAMIVTPAHAEIHGCKAETLHGSYIYSADGFVAQNTGLFKPIAEAGVYTFDGAGELTTTNTISSGGTIVPRTDTGTYSVNSDCTGSVSLTHGVTFNFAVSRSGSEMRFVVSTPSVSAMGSMTSK
jgi:hypothetical protein